MVHSLAASRMFATPIVVLLLAAGTCRAGLYSIGNPSNEEQLYLEYINRARADAVAESRRLAAETDSSIRQAYSSFGIDPQDIIFQFTTSVADGTFAGSAQPLSFNAKLLDMAGYHSQDMFTNTFQGHVSSSNPPAPFLPGYTLGQRAQSVGYSYSALAENVYAYSKSVKFGHAGFDVDWGADSPSKSGYNPAFAGQGMQNPAGHRKAIHNNNYKEIGVGVVSGSNGGVGPQIVTQDFGKSGTTTFVTGVVYEDLHANRFYDLGEGRAGVRIDVAGTGNYAISTASGGYSVPVASNGSYQVSFTGGGFASFATNVLIANSLNVKVDYLAVAPTLTADFSGNGSVGAEDLAIWKSAFGRNATGDANGDGLTNGLDYLRWQSEASGGFGAAPTTTNVPEPSTALMTATAIVLLAVRRRSS